LTSIDPPIDPNIDPATDPAFDPTIDPHMGPVVYPPTLTHYPLFVQDPYAKRFMKDEKITKTAYIANSGGLLGLCMGFSLGESHSIEIEQDLQNKCQHD
jgi:hypothetical protein